MDGVLNILKPPGMTSSNVVSAIRRITGIKRVGHTGTLDPGAAGVLPICIGKATRLFDYIAGKDKEYIAELTLGAVTDTQDSYGVLTGEFPIKDASEEAFMHALHSFMGKSTQVTPIYSAVKVQGKKMYELAREGQKITPKLREIDITDIALIKKNGQGRFLFRVTCSKGTYIRALAEDIGKKLNTGAYLSFLLRSRTGIFNVQDALTIEETECMFNKGELKLMPIESILCEFKAVHADETLQGKVRNGNPIPLSEISVKLSEGELARVYCNGVFYSLNEVKNGMLKVSTFFK